jgi:hypothetical protein
LILQEGCYNNILALDHSLAYDSVGATGPIADQTYLISTSGNSDNQLDLSSFFSSSLNPASCPLTANLFVWDESQNIWVDISGLDATNYPWVVGFDTAVGTV